VIPGYLLDTSVLLALGLDDHLQNSAAEQWLTRDVGRFATCPLTQLGFLRITKQLRRDISIHQIGAVLESICGDARHFFVAPDMDVRSADWRLILGHQQITDAYLAGLARQHGLKLATFDQGLAVTQSDVAVLVS
jgi:toxin-antitoxin system PIN domain toxin